MPINLIDTDFYEPTVTVPEAGDDRTAASLVPAFQALTNRTRSLLARIARVDPVVDAGGNLKSIGDVTAPGNVYAGINFSYDPVRDIQRVVPLSTAKLISFAGSDVYYYYSGTKISGHGGSGSALVFQFPIQVPNGSIIKRVRVAGKPNAAKLIVRVLRFTPDKSGAAPAASTVLPLVAPAEIDMNGAAGIITAQLVTPETVENHGSEYVIDVNMGASVGGNAEIYWADHLITYGFANPY